MADSKHPDDQFIEVAVATTSGFYPDSGADRVPIHQPIAVQLKKAQAALHIVDTNNWVATVNKQPIDPAKSYLDNGLKGTVEVDWGPSHGGGG